MHYEVDKIYESNRIVVDVMAEARRAAARRLGCHPDAVVFSSPWTDVHGIVRVEAHKVAVTTRKVEDG